MKLIRAVSLSNTRDIQSVYMYVVCDYRGWSIIAT